MSNERLPELIAAKLYDEISPEDERQLDALLQEDPAALETWEEMVATRDWIQKHRGEDPRPVAILGQRRRSKTQRWMGFAAGFAAAAVIFGLGFVSAEMWRGAPRDLDAIANDVREPTQQEFDVLDVMARTQDLEERLQSIERGAGIPAGVSTSEGAPSVQPVLTEASFNDGLKKMTHHMDLRWNEDVQHMMGELSVLEQRFDNRLETQDKMLRVILSHPVFHQSPDEVPTER